MQFLNMEKDIKIGTKIKVNPSGAKIIEGRVRGFTEAGTDDNGERRVIVELPGSKDPTKPRTVNVPRRTIVK